MTYSQKEVTDVMGDKDRQTRISEMEAVASSNQSNSEEMVRHQFVIIFPRLFQAHCQDQDLLKPVCTLYQIIELERSVVYWRIICKHCAVIEIPYQCPFHDIKEDDRSDNEEEDISEECEGGSAKHLEQTTMLTTHAKVTRLPEEKNCNSFTPA